MLEVLEMLEMLEMGGDVEGVAIVVLDMMEELLSTVVLDSEFFDSGKLGPSTREDFFCLVNEYNEIIRKHIKIKASKPITTRHIPCPDNVLVNCIVMLLGGLSKEFSDSGEG